MMRGYALAIAEITGVTDDEDLRQIEELMRLQAGGVLDRLTQDEFRDLAEVAHQAFLVLTEDDALDRLHAYVAPESRDGHVRQALATVREALERQRRHPDAWSQEAFDQQKARAEAAEAEVRRLTEGLRDLIKEAPEALDQNAVWVDDLLDLLSASPSDGGEPWESFASSQGGIFNGPHPADEEPGGGGAK